MRACPTAAASCSALEEYGPAITTEEVAGNSIETAFSEALDELESELKVDGVTGSIRHTAREIAILLDKAISSAIITAKNDKHFNREAYLDLLGAHSSMVAALVGLDTVPTCYSNDESDGQPKTTH